MPDDYKPKTRQEIYDRIRATSKDEYILSEMIRLGFWPARGQAPNDPAEEIHQRAAVRAEIDKLQQQLARTANLEALRREIRERRMRESTEKQKQTRERREAERQRRTAAFTERKRAQLIHLGEGVSANLHRNEGDPARLAQRGLPSFADAADMARQMGVTLGELRFLAFQRKVSTRHHYARFSLPKKTGGERIISAPMPRLKKAQHWVLRQILEKVPVHDAAHGFRAGRSIVTNAAPHQRQAVVVNLDLKDFFPSVDYRRVRGVFRALGYGDAFATVLALICTEADVDLYDLDGVRYFVQTGPRKLPQGAPTSPALTNILCSGLDRRLRSVSASLGFAYTRYADDLTFSFHPGQVQAGSSPQPAIGALLRGVTQILKGEGFAINADKTRVMHVGDRQSVTGLIVNEAKNAPAVRVPRDTLRKLRAAIHNREKGKPGKEGESLEQLKGMAAFVFMTDPDKGRALMARIEALAARQK